MDNKQQEKKEFPYTPLLLCFAGVIHIFFLTANPKPTQTITFFFAILWFIVALILYLVKK